jgi:hypothetical protein
MPCAIVHAMSGDVVRKAVEISGGTVAADEVLRWLADIVRSLRTSPTAACGAAGRFFAGEEAGTVEINPASRLPQAGYSSKSLVFESSPALDNAIALKALTEEGLAALASENPVADCFAKALATELVLRRRAAIGNFGIWTIGQMPDLRHFVRFRSKAAINQML